MEEPIRLSEDATAAASVAGIRLIAPRYLAIPVSNRIVNETASSTKLKQLIRVCLFLVSVEFVKKFFFGEILTAGMKRRRDIFR